MTQRSTHVSETVRDIVSALFNLSRENVISTTSHVDTKAWDSVGHLNLVLALQEEFSIVVEPEDFEKLNDVGAIIDYVMNSTNAQKHP